MTSRGERVVGPRLNSQLKKGYSTFPEDRRPAVLGTLAGAVLDLPTRAELSYGKRHREYYVLMLRPLYRNAAIGYARIYDRKFTESRIGEDSEAAREYQKFHSMIDDVSQEDIRYALEVLPSRKTQVQQ